MFQWIWLWTWTVLSIFLELSYGCIVLDHHLGVLLFEVTTSKSSQSDLDQYWKELLFYCHEFITIRLRHKFLMVVDDTKVNSGSWNESAKISASSFGCSIQTVKPTSLMHTWLVFLIHNLSHRRRKCEHCSPNSLRPIYYFGSIWELYVLDLKTKVFCRKENQLHFPMNKGLTVPKYSGISI